MSDQLIALRACICQELSAERQSAQAAATESASELAAKDKARRPTKELFSGALGVVFPLLGKLAAHSAVVVLSLIRLPHVRRVQELAAAASKAGDDSKQLQSMVDFLRKELETAKSDLQARSLAA